MSVGHDVCKASLPGGYVQASAKADPSKPIKTKSFRCSRPQGDADTRYIRLQARDVSRFLCQ